MSRDIRALLAIYTILILVGWNIGLSYKVDKEFEGKIEAMKVAIEINNTLEIHREMNLSLNVEIDNLMNELNEFRDLDKLKKDLDRSR